MHNYTITLLAIIGIIVRGNVINPRIPKLDGRIVGGGNTTIENFPFLVSVRFLGIHFCGGSIISKRIVITAGHCVFKVFIDDAYSIQYGTSIIGGEHNVIFAKRVLQHENYNKLLNNDIGLIFLVAEIPFSAVAQPIQLTSIAPATGESATISGWGVVAEGGPKATILQQVSVQIIDRMTCQERYKGISDITEMMLCAGTSGGGKDACKDDSGGPLVSNGQLVGIISFGKGCGRVIYPGVYTNIAALKNWIDLNIIE